MCWTMCLIHFLVQLLVIVLKLKDKNNKCYNSNSIIIVHGKFSIEMNKPSAFSLHVNFGGPTEQLLDWTDRVG